jgi:hypothetical protein
MIEPNDLELMRPVGAKDNRWGQVAVRRPGGGLTVARVAWRTYRWTMIQFAKFVLVEFGMVASSSLVEEVVDAWIASRPNIF